MCKYSMCNNNCPYKKCSKQPSKNLQYIYSKKNNGPMELFSMNTANDILLVFEAPGIDEWCKGEPICSKRRGSAGYKFNSELNKIGKQKQNYDIVEAVRCFPGKSTVGANQKIQTELEKAAKYCNKFLKQVILSKNYIKIICFGKIAKKSICSTIRRLGKNGNKHYTSVYAKTCVFYLTHPMGSSTLEADIKKHL